MAPPRSTPPSPPSPYDKALFGILEFSTFTDAERTITKLDDLSRSYQSVGDMQGMECCRQIARLGRRRAELISRNRRVDATKRAQKEEIARWFAVWLETPALFDDWLALRKTTEEFRLLYAKEPGTMRNGKDATNSMN